jgi:hypothetical protein
MSIIQLHESDTEHTSFETNKYLAFQGIMKCSMREISEGVEEKYIEYETLPTNKLILHSKCYEVCCV